MLTKKKFQIILTAAILFLLFIVGWCLFAPVSKSAQNSYVYIDRDDDIDSVSAKLSEHCKSIGVSSFLIFARHSGYVDNIRTGRYEITPDMGALQLLRRMRNGQQSPVRLTVPSVRTVDRLAEELSKKLMVTKAELLATLATNDSCAHYGCDTATIVTLFIPNTYEVYWNISVQKLMNKMQQESKRFWNTDRQKKAEELGLSPVEVMTLASIVDEETANNAEKPMVAGMYYNRLQQAMPLQADPTIKFALKDFSIRRIYHKMLLVNSPYNTYANTGLPPGPIRIPSVAGIDAVLNLVRHDYLYMCAREDFSGTHNFARTYPEHLRNAAKYTRALNERGIK